MARGDSELNAINRILKILGAFKLDSRNRIMDYVCGRCKPADGFLGTQMVVEEQLAFTKVEGDEIDTGHELSPRPEDFL